MASVIVANFGLVVIGGLTVPQARAEQSLWRKCRRSESVRELHRQIGLGKSRLR
jgi:hypothetical protein